MTFEARYATKCPACGEMIHPGDDVTWSAEQVVHATCPEPTDPLAIERQPCSRCFMVPASNGTCGCEESE